MAAAEVGDDVFGDDPTIKRLENYVAQLFGKEAALFVPTGTQGNLIAVMAHTWERSSEFIIGDKVIARSNQAPSLSNEWGSRPTFISMSREDLLHSEELTLESSGQQMMEHSIFLRLRAASESQTIHTIHSHA